ncbi:hypothetical protein WA026_010382 [Henosepilachna vigintioctopunctata]|uniref:Chitin-binding type-2 domain-containing protein n=1 Tax=Henosepilachna vigintioctopunctata TaxID=420089 RepID=A0AAW1VAY5_9CUCU
MAYRIFALLLLIISTIDISFSQRKVPKHSVVTVDVKTAVQFDCPEEFGYYPHPDDCTQYYVCVFGGALLESCTGGLMYSQELQTCDWPRNVGCDGVNVAPVATAPSTSSNSRVKEEYTRTRYTPPPPPKPSAQVISRGQPRQQQIYHDEEINLKQQQLYQESEETLPEVQEEESDRQQRFYRGQPSTIGQVQRDRDGLRQSNAIAYHTGQKEKIGVISFGVHQAQDHQRAEATTSGPEPASATSRTLVSTSQYSANSYSPYEQEYDDKVKYEYNSYNEPQPSAAPVSYRSRTPAPSYQSLAQDDIQSSKRSNAIQNDYVRNIYQEQSVPEYHDVTYDNAEEDHSSYRQSSRQQLRDDRKESNLIEDQPTPKSKHRISTTYSSSTSRYTTKKPVKSSSASVSHKQNTASSRTNNRGRGTGHYTSGNVVTNDVTVNTINVNRGTPPPRSRPTLKPSTSIVSKAQEFVDIYRYPPRRPDPIYPQPQPDKTAAKCRKDVCLLPDCNCGGKDIPGDIPPEQVPQIVLLTFDDSVNDLNKGLYQDLFEKGRVNPNGCPISATFYVSHEWTDYSQVQNLYSDGHEIASHTVSHSFGEQFSQKKWTREVAGQREILAAYGGVHLEDVRGMRAPFLSVGGNKMFKMLYDSNFTYDSSMPIYENKPPSWPYTLDYKLFHDCMIPPCPTRSYPGVWEVPMVMWQDLNGGRCSMGDACSNPSEPEGVRKMIMKNFMRHYTTNRAPFGLFYHAAWFTQPHHKEGFINLLDDILAMKDVWVLTNWQAVEWVRNPTPTSRLGSFKPFQCDYSDRPKRCNNPKVCNLWHKSGVRYMRTCQPCPEIYPWTGNSGIRSSRIDNDIED